jgi:hypothetical protein
MALGREQKELIITGLMVVVLIGVVSANIRGRAKKRKRPRAGVETSQAEVAAPLTPLKPATDLGDIPDPQVLRQQEVRIQDDTWKRDPFSVPPVKFSLGTENLKLKGISFSQSGESFAIVNDMILKKGDYIGDSQILRIEQNRVIMADQEGNQYSLILEE